MASGPSATAQPQLSEQVGKLRPQQGQLLTGRDDTKAQRTVALGGDGAGQTRIEDAQVGGGPDGSSFRDGAQPSVSGPGMARSASCSRRASCRRIKTSSQTRKETASRSEANPTGPATA